MRRRSFGTTDLETSAVGFGTWALGSDWWGEHEEPDELVARALDLGITFFDTGDTYGQGLNEELVGTALVRSGRTRDAYELSTKFGYVLDSGRQAHSEGERVGDAPRHGRRGQPRGEAGVQPRSVHAAREGGDQEHSCRGAEQARGPRVLLLHDCDATDCGKKVEQILVRVKALGEPHPLLEQERGLRQFAHAQRRLCQIEEPQNLAAAVLTLPGRV